MRRKRSRKKVVPPQSQDFLGCGQRGLSCGAVRMSVAALVVEIRPNGCRVKPKHSSLIYNTSRIFSASITTDFHVLGIRFGFEFDKGLPPRQGMDGGGIIDRFAVPPPPPPNIPQQN